MPVKLLNVAPYGNPLIGTVEPIVPEAVSDPPVTPLAWSP